VSREWKPGDVATFGSSIAMRTIVGWAYGDGSTGGPHQDAYPVRPLVVIDPDDREQVRRLADAFCTARWSHLPGSDECDPLTFSSMQAALRELANPTPPKPDEPTGLGAVVDAAAYSDVVRVFVRGPGDRTPWIDASGNGHTWAELDVDRVLSEGLR